MRCPTDSEIVALCQGHLDERDEHRIEAHLDACEICRALVVQFLQSSSGTQGRAEARILLHGNSRPFRAEPEADTLIGRRYLLLSSIGQGGMGQVFRAYDRLTGDQVALKLVFLRTESHAVFLAKEFRTLATLRHPSIISVLDYGFDPDRGPYFTMDLLEDARTILPAMCDAPQSLQLKLIIDLLHSLSYLHRRRILHGDIKPSNIVLVGPQQSPSLRLLDFGLSLSQDDEHPDSLAGTPAYMAPELFSGAAQSPASDLFSVGVLAFEMLTGQHPFGWADSPSTQIHANIHNVPALSLLPKKFRPLFARWLHESAAARPCDAMSLAAELALVAGIERPRDPVLVHDGCLLSGRFCGRQEELQTLRDALAAAHHGQGAAWLIRGESGAGKSRLLEELRSLALLDGVLVVRGQSVPTGETAYHLWQDVLRVLALQVDLDDLQASVLSTVLPDLDRLLERTIQTPPPLEIASLRFRLLSVLREIIARVPCPVLVLLEDLQWADAESLALLASISQDAGSLPLLLIATCRKEERLRLPVALPALQTLWLQRLERSAVLQLSDSLLGAPGRDQHLVDLLMRETEGNALFVLEVLRALAEQSGSLDWTRAETLPSRVFPGGVEAVLRRRLVWLSEDAQRLIRIAAVAGRQLDLALLETDSGSLTTLVQECAEAGVLEMHEQKWRFSHDKLRDCVLSELELGSRQKLHAEVARRLRILHADHPAQAARIAYHLRESSQSALACQYYIVAGEAALRRGTPSEAESEFSQALLIQQQIGADLVSRVQARRGLAQAQFGLGKMADAADSVRAVCSLVGQPLPTDTGGFSLMLLRQVLEQAVYRIGLQQQVGPLIRAVNVCSPAWDLRHELLSTLSVQEAFVWLDEPHLSLLCTLWGLNLEQRMINEPDRRGTSFGTALCFLLSFTPLRSLGVRYLRQHRLASGADAEIDHLRVMALVLVSEGRFDDAVLTARRAVSRARAQRDDLSLMYSLLPLLLAKSGLDEYVQVMSLSQEMESLATRMQNPRYAVIAHAWQGAASLRAGDFARAEAQVARARSILPPELGPVPESLLLGLTSLIAFRCHKPAQAKEWAQQTLACVERARFPMADLRHPLSSVLDVLLSLPGPQDAQRLMDQALSHLHKVAGLFPIARANYHLCAGRQAWRKRQSLRAVLHLRRSLSFATSMAQKYDQAQALLWLGIVGSHRSVRMMVQENPRERFAAAHALFLRIGAPWEAEQTDAAARTQALTER